MSLSPLQDLYILAAVCNNPQPTWSTISAYILQKHNVLIPSEVCEDRYQNFLRHIKSIQSPHQLLPYALKNVDNLDKQMQPQNCIFDYIELRNKMVLSLDKTATQVQEYSKRNISKLFYPKITKIKQIGIQEQKVSKFVDLIYNEIKARSSVKSTLTQSIINQKVEQIFFEIVQKVNEVLQSHSVGKIQNPYNIIKLFNPNSLIDQKRQIFQRYFYQGLNIETAQLIKDKLNFISTLFAYQHIQNEDEHHLEQSKTYDQIEYSQQEKPFSPNDKNYSLNEGMLVEEQHQMGDKKGLSNRAIDEEDNMVELEQHQSLHHFNQIYSQMQPPKPPEQPDQREQDKKCKFSYQSMQITVSNNLVKIVQQQHPSEVIKQQAKIQQVKYQQCTDNKQKGIKRYRMVKKRKAISKMPKCKVLIVLKD